MNRISTNIKKDFDSLWAGDESELVAGERSLYTRRPPGTVARAGCSLRRAARCPRSPASQTLPPPQPTAHRTNSTLRLILLLQNKQHISSPRNPSNLDKYSWVKCWLVLSIHYWSEACWKIKVHTEKRNWHRCSSVSTPWYTDI